MFKFISKANGEYKWNYSFRINVTEEIFEIRSCLEILANVLQLIKNYNVYIMWDLHPLGGITGLDMCDLFWDDYNVFVLGELTEL